MKDDESDISIIYENEENAKRQKIVKEIEEKYMILLEKFFKSLARVREDTSRQTPISIADIYAILEV